MDQEIFSFLFLSLFPFSHSSASPSFLLSSSLTDFP